MTAVPAIMWSHVWLSCQIDRHYIGGPSFTYFIEILEPDDTIFRFGDYARYSAYDGDQGNVVSIHWWIAHEDIL